MRALVLLLAVICVGLSVPLVGWGQTREIDCERLVFCAGVKDREPVGASDAFPPDVFSVYCFTAIVGAGDSTAVTHNWYYGDTKMATVELPVKSARWRTWSSKRMIPEWSGVWRVDVTTGDGVVIKSGEFTLE